MAWKKRNEWEPRDGLRTMPLWEEADRFEPRPEYVGLCDMCGQLNTDPDLNYCDACGHGLPRRPA